MTPRAPWLAPFLAAALVCGVALLPSGCQFRGLRKNIERLEQLGLIGGHVSVPESETAPVIVLLATITPPTVIDSYVLEHAGSYFFAAPAGTYRIAAFVDRNRDFTYQAGEEIAAYYGAPTDVPLAAGQKRGDVDLRLEAGSRVHLDLSITPGQIGKRGSHELPDIQLGTVVTLDDPRFSEKNAKLGLWRPVDFLFQVGSGYYFLEPYSAAKTPVLFIHGAGGQPGNWRYLIEHLDRKRFQPWLLYYPSGLDLEVIARGAARWLNALGTRYEFKHIVIVAHSMGGLVARAAINRLAATPGSVTPQLFVSISTPWNGHSAAALGVKEAPVVMPMWLDVAPGSPFLTALFRTPLPPHCPYYLLFSYNGHSLFLREPNDGVVALSSELAMRAQEAAVKVYGFDASHVGILNDSDTSRLLNALLASVTR